MGTSSYPLHDLLPPLKKRVLLGLRQVYLHFMMELVSLNACLKP